VGSYVEVVRSARRGLEIMETVTQTVEDGPLPVQVHGPYTLSVIVPHNAVGADEYPLEVRLFVVM
jgi:hypothetical protein